jgi:hypothetical protein
MAAVMTKTPRPMTAIKAAFCRLRSWRERRTGNTIIMSHASVTVCKVVEALRSSKEGEQEAVSPNTHIPACESHCKTKAMNSGIA